jgi:FkbM family methyltransferase
VGVYPKRFGDQLIKVAKTVYSRVFFDTRCNYPTDNIVIDEVFNQNVYELTGGHFDKDGVTVDLGANIGAFSIYAAEHGTKVISVEPEPNNLKALKRNIKINDMSSLITVAPYAISDYIGSAKINNDGGDSTILYNTDGFVIDVITLDKLFDLYQVEEVNVLKIDIEGSEVQAVLGSSKETMSKCKYVAIEFDIKTGDQMGDIIKKLSETHHTRTMGSWKRGGMIWAWLY